MENNELMGWEKKVVKIMKNIRNIEKESNFII